MARESFESPDIARLLNEHFVSIKVDREEHPDVDAVYMTATEALTGHGGWPMSVFLEPVGHKPFFAGTYFPPNDGERGVRVGLHTVLTRLAAAWRSDREKVVGSADAIAAELIAYAEHDTNHDRARVPVPDAADSAAHAVAAVARGFDERNGGHKGAPKFPSSTPLALLADLAALGDTQARTMALTTLTKMLAGGIHDVIDGGFHRYSVDDVWHVPHFEKMLVDNAVLTSALVQAFQLTADDSFAHAARAALAFVDDVLSVADGFGSATDADSVDDDGAVREGAYFVFGHGEVVDALAAAGLDDHARDLVCAFFDIRPAGNFADAGPGTDLVRDAVRDVPPDVVRDAPRHAPRHAPRSVLRQRETRVQLAQRLRTDVAVVDDAVARALPVLRTLRNAKRKPARDGKIVAAYNGLAISAFVDAAFAFGDDVLLARAERAFAFVQDHLRLDAGADWRLARHAVVDDDGVHRSAIAGVVDDHAFVCRAAVDLYCATGKPAYKAAALAIDDVLAAHFADARGGFFVSADPPLAGQSTPLLFREKSDRCGAEPAGSSVHVHTLARLAALTGDDRFRARAVRGLDASAAVLTQAPHLVPELVRAQLVLARREELVVVVPAGVDRNTDPLVALARRRPRAGGVFVVVDHGDVDAGFALVHGRAAAASATATTTTAHHCQHNVCALPLTEARALFRALDAARTPASLSRERSAARPA